MPIEDIVAEKTGTHPRVVEQRQRRQTRRQAQQRAGSLSSIDTDIQIDRQDMMVWIQLAQLVVLLLILRNL